MTADNTEKACKVSKMTSTTTFMSSDECDRRHKTTQRIFTWISSVMAIGVVIVSWAVAAGYNAQENAQGVRTDLQVHMAHQQGESEKIQMALDRIEEILAETRSDTRENKQLLETLMRRQPPIDPGE